MVGNIPLVCDRLIQRTTFSFLLSVGLLLIGSVFSKQAHATHAMGGDVTYTCIGANMYQLQLSFFRDCNGVAAPTNCSNGLSYSVQSTQCGANFTGCFAFQSVQVVTPICSSALDRCVDPAGQYGVEKYIYTSTLDLSAYSGCGTDWSIEWELCCRNNAITSLIDPGNERLHLYAQLDNTLDPCNNSPTFLNDPTPFGCVGQPNAYNHGYSDQDGDSLVFSLTGALGQNGQPIPYNTVAGYSAQQPILTSGGTNAVNIDPITGTISFVANQQQFAVVSVLVEEYRDGVKIGEYLRDVQFAIITCTNQFPTATGVDGTNNFTTEVCANEQLCFDISSFDPDAGDNLTMTWNMGVPGASFNVGPGSNPTGTFCWTPTPGQIGSYLFTVQVEDDACVLSASNTYGYVVYVTPPFAPGDAGPDQDVCGSSASLNGFQPYTSTPGTWSVVSGSGTFDDANGASTQVNGLTFGTNVFEWSVDYGSCGIATDQVTITAFDPNQGPANAGFDQQQCLPDQSVTMNGNAAVGAATGTWTLISGGGTIVDPLDPTTTVNNLPVGDNVFQWTIDNGPCIPSVTTDQVTVTIFDNNQPSAQAGPDQEICTPANTVTMAAVPAVAPATGFWTIVQGSATIANPNNPNTQISNLSVGENIFRWVLANGPCIPTTTQDDVSVFVFDQNGPAANAGPDQELCTPTGTISLQGNIPTFPGVGNWALVSGQGTVVDPSNPTTQVTGLGVGDNVFEYIIDNGPCPGGITNDQVVITVYDQNSPSANAGPDQELCTPTTSTFLAGSTPIYPATGQWTLVSGQGNIASAAFEGTFVSNLGVGQNVFRWTVNNGPCPNGLTQDDVTIWVFDSNSPAADAGPDQELCFPTSNTNLAGNPSIFPAVGTWTLVSGSGNVTSPNNPNTGVTGLAIGENIFQWSIDNGPCTPPVTIDQVSIFLFDPNNPNANAGPDQDLCTPQTSTTLAGSSLTFPATGQWTVVQGSASFADATQPNTTVSGLTIGETILRWTVDNGPCPNGTTQDDVSLFLFNGNASVANAGPDQDLCSNGNSTTLAGNAPAGVAVGTWSVQQGAATFTDANDPTTAVSGLGVGENILEWSIDNGSCGISTDLVSIFIYDVNNPDANAGADQDLCSDDPTTLLIGSGLTFPATGSWTLVSGSGNIIAPNSATTGVSALGIGENVFQWTVDNGPCPNGTTSDQVSIFVYDQNNPNADAGPDQEICIPVAPSQVTLQGSMVTAPAVGTWTILSGGGTITSPNDPNSTVTGLTVGETVIQWSVDNGPCSNGVTTDVMSVYVFDAANPLADAGPDQNICTPTASVTLAGSNAIFPATGQWIVVQGPATITDPADPTSTVTGLGVGEVILEWTVSNGPCANPITSDQVSIFIFDQNNPNANAGPDQDICTPQTSTSLAGSSVTFPATGQWTIVQGSGSFADATDPNTTISGLTIGETILQWEVSNGPCANGVTNDQMSIFLFNGNASVADAGPDQNLCSDNASTTLAGNAPTGVAVGTWSVQQGAATFTDPNDPTTAVSGLPIGENILVWSIDNGSCGISTDQISIFVYDQSNPNADAGPDQDLCTPILITALAGSNVTFPAVGTWTLVSGSGTIASANLPNSGVSGLAVGENIFRWTVDNGPCANGITSDEVSIFVFDANNPNANAGPDQDLCTPTASTTLAGSSVTFPATGQWTVVQGTANFADATDPTTTISGFGVGETILEWTVSNGPCANGLTTDQMSIFLFDASNPDADAGTDQEICVPVAPSMVTLQGSSVTFPAVGTWTVLSGSGNVTDPNDPNSTVTGLTVGETVIQWSVDNGPCPNGVTTDVMSVYVFDAANPNANAGLDQDLCTPQSSTTLAGSNVIFPATGQWTLIQGSGTFVDATDPNTTFNGLTIGETILEWTVDNGPCVNGVTSDQVSIFLFNGNASVADAGPDQDRCSDNASTALVGNAPTGVATGTWSVQQGTANFVDPTDPTTTVNGLQIGENILVWSIDNGSCGISTDQVSIFVYDENNPNADAGPDQDLCTPTTTTTLAGSSVTFPAVGTWTVVQGTGVFTDANDPTTTVTGLSVGENTFEWTVDNGPCTNGITNDQVSIFLYDDGNPDADAGPDQEICVPVAPSQVTLQGNAVTFPAVGTWSIVSGSGVISNVNDPNSTVTGLTVGETVIQWNVDNGPCANGITTDVMSVFVFDAANPLADAGPDQDICTPTASVTMAGSNVIFPATGQWTVLQGPATITDPTDPTTTVTGLGVGEVILEWTVSNGPCANPITSDPMSIFIYDDANPDANAGLDQDLCTPQTSTTLVGSALTFPATGQWTIIQGAGSFVDDTDPNTTFNGLTIGETILQWEVSNGPCANGVTSDQMSIFLFNGNASVADAGPDQDLCSDNASTTLAGNAPTGVAVGTWSVQQGAGTFTDPNDPTTDVTGLQIGENILEWSIDNGSCGISTDVVSIFVYDENNPDADAGSDQDLCTPVTTATLAGSNVTFPAIGTWTLVQGTGGFTDPNDPTTTVTGLSVGENIFAWTVDNGPCANGVTNDVVSVFLFDDNAPQADAGPDQDLCSDNNFTTLAATVPVGVAFGTWSVSQGGGSFADVNDPNTTVSGLPVGENVLEWSIDNGSCGISTDQVSIFVYDENNPNADAGPDQDLCTPITSATLAGSIVTFPAVGTWTVIQGSATFTDPNDPTTSANGLTVGETIVQWTVDNGPCANGITSDQVSLFLFNGNASVADAGPDQDLCSDNASTTLAGNAPTGVAVGTWSVQQGAATFADPNDPTTDVSDLQIGENILQWSIDNGSCGISNDLVSIFVYDENNPDADAGPDQDLCTPVTSTTMAGSAVTFPAQGTWTLAQGTGVFADANDPTTGITGLSVGENIFTWTVDNGPCANGVTNDVVSIFLFDDNAPQADAGQDQDLCSDNNFITLAASATVGSAMGTWTVAQGVATFADVNDPATVASAIPVGENILVWSIDNGSCGISSDSMSVFVFDENNLNADAGPDQDLCTPDTTTTMVGSAVTFPATGTWTVFAGTGIFIDDNDPATAVTGLTVGENVFIWTVDNGPCANGITMDTMSVFVFDAENLNADAGPDQELCTPTSTTTLAGSAITFPATGMWTLVQGTGTFTDATDPTTDVSDLSIGENIFEWTALNGPCANANTSDQVSIFVFDENNLDADAGPDQQLCTPDTTTTMAGSANTFPAVGTWSLIQGTGDIVDMNDPSTAITGLTVGDNIFVWSVYNGTCANANTSDTVVVAVFDENNPDANAGTDQDLCTPVSTSQLAGSPVTYPAIGTWSLAQGTGVFTDPNDPTTMVTGITVGENIYVWTVDNGPCANGVTSDPVSVFLFDDNAPQADAGPDQDLCSDNATTTLAGSSSVGAAIGTWTVTQGTATFTDANDPMTDVAGLSIGENVLLWSIDNGSCGISTDSMSVFVYDENNPNANAGVDQSYCTPTDTATMAGSAVTFPAVGTWALIGGTAVIDDMNDPTSDISGLTIGENVFTWTVNNGPCANGVTTDTMSIFIFDDQNATSDAGPDQQWCTPDTTTFMAGSTVTFPASGQWDLIQGTAVIADSSDPASAITGLTVGENIFTWSVFNGPCTNPGAVDTMSIFIFDENNPNANAGPDQQQCTPDTTMTMAGSNVIFPAQGIWSLIQGTANIADPNDPNTFVSGLSVGENRLVWTVDNGPCPNGITADTVSLFIFDSGNLPANAGPDQALCTPDTTTSLSGSAVISPAFGTWTVVQGTGVLTDANDPNTFVSGLTVGEHIFAWTVDNSPCTNPITSDTVTVLVYDQNSPNADAGDSIEVCLPLTSTFLSGNTPIFPATGMWTIQNGPGTLVDPTDPTTTLNNLTPGITTLIWTLDNGPCPNGVTRDTVIVMTFDNQAPLADAGPDIDLCYPDTTTTLGGNTPLFPSYGWWTLVSGTGTFTDSTLQTTSVTGLSIGVNVFVWTIYNGFCGFGAPESTDTMLVNVFDPNVDSANAGPDQDLCTPITSIQLAADTVILPATGWWSTTSSGAVFSDTADANATVSGLGVGQHTLTWSIDNGPCTTGWTTDDVVINIFDENAPQAIAGADQSICTPQDTVTMEGNAPVFPASGWWTLESGSGVFADSTDMNTLVSGLQVGINEFVWHIDNGPCPNGITTDTVAILVYDGNHPPADAGPDQDICTPITDAQLSANTPIIPATGMWTFAAGFGTLTDPTDPNTTVSDLQVGQVVLVWSINNGPCPNSLLLDTMVINVFDSNADPAMAGPDQFFCTPINDPVEMFANSAVFPAIGTWMLISGAGVIIDPNDPFTEVTDLGFGENVFEWQIDNNACGSGFTTDQISIFLYDSMEDTAYAGESQQFCQDVTTTNLAALPPMSTGVGTWSLFSGNGTVVDPSDPNTEVTDLQEGYNVFLWTMDNGTCGTTMDTMSVYIKDCLTLTIPDAFSPNGDGYNDVYEILNIESYPESHLQVFNRYGSKVLDRSPYNNDWDGRSEHSMTFGDLLPESTYYYILTLGDDKDTYNGFIYLRR